MARKLGLLFLVQMLAAQNLHAATQAQIDQAWNLGLKFMLLSQHRDGGWSSSIQDGNTGRQALGIQATSATVEAMSSIGLKAGYAYSGGLAWLSNAEAASIDALARQTIALKAAGVDVAALGSRLAAGRNPTKTWGAYAGYEAGLPDTALGMIGLSDALSTSYSSTDLLMAVCRLVLSRRADSLWSYSLVTAGATPATQLGSAVIPSAHALLALVRAGARISAGTCNSTAFTTADVIATGVAALVTRQSALDKGFGDNGASAVLETAWALRALKAAAPTHAALATAVDFLIAQQRADGSWGAGDALQTGAVLLALAAAGAPRPSAAVVTDIDKDGVPDAVEALLGTNSAVADSRFLADDADGSITPSAVTRMAATQLSPLAASAAPSPSRPDPNAWTEQADVEVFIVGTAAELPVLEKAAQSVLQADAMETFALVPQPASDLYRAFFGSFAREAPGPLAGKRVLVHFSAAQGSYAAVAAVARGQPVARMLVGPDCIASAHRGRWFCPGIVVDRTPDAGISENEPAAQGSAGEGRPPASAAEIAQLDARPLNRLRWGVGSSAALAATGLHGISRTRLGEVISGAVRSWDKVDARLAPKPVVLCRLPDGAQTAAFALLGFACDGRQPMPPSAASPAAAVLAAPGLLVREARSYAEARQCLDEADAGASVLTEDGPLQVPMSSYAIAILPRSDPQSAASPWLPADAGESTAWMQWRRPAHRAGQRLSEDQLALLGILRERMADAIVIAGVPGVMPVSARSPGPSAGASCPLPVGAGH